MPDIQHFYSDRGIPLTHWRDMSREMTFPNPTLCVESYMKWYTLFLVHPDGTVEPVCYTELPDPGWHDHEPHPLAVAKLAEERGWCLCPEAEELILARWFLSRCELTTEEVLERKIDTIGES